MQSESVELWILLSWSDELTIYTLLLLHHAFHIACMWSNSKYEDINIVSSKHSTRRWGRASLGGLQPPKPLSKTTTDYKTWSILKKDLIDKLFLQQYDILYQNAEKGCIYITWLKSTSIATLLKKNLAKTGIKFFSNHGIDTVIIDGLILEGGPIFERLQNIIATSYYRNKDEVKKL